MRISIVSFLMVFFAINDCSHQELSSIQSFSYETFTRGSATVYTITPEMINIKSTGLEAGESSAKIQKKDWESLVNKAQKVNINEISRLKAPSESRASDAALHAILSVRKNDTVYKTNSFDHGNAPSEVKPLVQAILRLAENVE
ncbi:hypothetical protein [Christiangramia aquimixticola]|uniref:hypothetical protein n=1 Tax=Christiangramia aquimixticola TaxID=1697558 RepID=UPI003AA7E728